MKKILLALALTFSTSSFSQLAPPKQKINLHLSTTSYSSNSSNVRVGPGLGAGSVMMLGGASFIVAGVLTTPVYVSGSTTEKKPFLQQGGKAAAIISGCLVLTGGIVISIGGY